MFGQVGLTYGDASNVTVNFHLSGIILSKVHTHTVSLQCVGGDVSSEPLR